MAEHRTAVYVIGSASTPDTLTASYDDTTSAGIAVGSSYQVALDVAYTMGTAETGNSVQIKVEFSADNSTWYRQSALSTSSGTTTVSLQEYTFTATQSAGTYDRLHISIPVDALYMRVAAKETGIASNGGSLTVILTLTEDHS